ncbi:porin [Chelativorans alearense]|uniref:porin n=1 Tax=Chelativorans alearense TaxID=2681495 RepID=UPI0013D426E2|nr:porin [Chelativorans alearense]
MNIKSLLIGSAAATVAATGAQAADSVCDVYGAGFFYIPGTETCLKIGGYVRYEIGFDEDDDGWRKLARGTLTVDARSETEYGTLGGFIELRGDVKSGSVGNPDDNNWIRVQQAIISLGGFSMGLSDTLYDAALSGEFDNGGGDRVHFMRYTFDAANGVFVTIALEEADYNEDYTPNVVGNVGIAQGWGSFNVWGAYDATAEEWAAKAIAKIKATEQLTVELMGTYESDESFYSVSKDGFGGYEWTAGGYLKYAATPKLSVGFGGQYFADAHFDSADNYALGAVVDYELVENFNTKLAVNYFDGDNYDDGHVGGFLRFDRNF